MASPSSNTPTATPSTTASVSSSPEAPPPPSSSTSATTALPAATTSTASVAPSDSSAASATPGSSASSVNGDDQSRTPSQALQRPKMGTRKSSGTIIVPREHPRVELKEGDEVFDADDARAMSPRRSSQDLEKMGQEARAQLNEHAKVLQDSLLEIFNRIEAVKHEHDKLDNNNKFLQKYIGDLMSTSKITSTGASGRKK